MTATPIAAAAAPERWRYSTVASSIGRDPTRFPATRVIGEIKPHSTREIRKGILQLRRHYNSNRGRGFSYQLVTYRQVPGDVTRYNVLVADPIELGRVVRSVGGQGGVSSWYGIKQVRLQDATAPIPLWQCGPMLGNRLEPKVRALYQGWMRNVQGHAGLSLPMRSASSSGADFAHEAAEFLRELAGQLEVGVLVNPHSARRSRLRS